MATQVKPDDLIEAVVVWKNIGQSVYAPRFRLDLRRSGLLETWNEGGWATSPSVAPGAQGTALVPKYVPTDWTPTTISAKVMLDGREGAVQTWPDLFQIPTPAPTAADVQIISISITGGTTSAGTPTTPAGFITAFGAATTRAEVESLYAAWQAAAALNPTLFDPYDQQIYNAYIEAFYRPGMSNQGRSFASVLVGRR